MVFDFDPQETRKKAAIARMEIIDFMYYILTKIGNYLIRCYFFAIKVLHLCNMVKKTSPTGIRFDIEHLDYIKIREKLKSPQEVVNFLLEAYWNVWHIPKNPFNTTPNEEPKNEPAHRLDIKKGFDYFLAQIKDIESEEEGKDFVADVQASDLGHPQKTTLIDRLKSKWL